MSVTLSPPSQLGFPRPLTTVVKRSLFIQNPHSSPVAFKVKTTAPKQYCVRPNQGRVEPGQNIEVQIVLQPLQVDPPPHAKCKDKFLVQSAFIPPGEEMHTLPEMWATVEKTNKAAIHEQKIRCAYLAAEDGSGDPNGIPEEEESGSPLDHSRLDESYAHGYTHWTTAAERQFDADIYPNGGHTVWELPEPQPKVQEMPVAPAPVVAPPPPPKEDVPQKKPTSEIVLNVGENPTIIVLSSPPHAVFAAAEQSPVPKVNGGGDDKDLPATPIPSYGLAGAAAAAAGLGAAGGAAVAAAANSAPESPVVAAPIAAPVAEASREIPSLSADDVQAVGAPTNIALEKSLNATTNSDDKLAVALAEIERLKGQLAEAQGPTVTGLRKRGGAGAGVGAVGAPVAGNKVATQTATQGVPLEVCAGLVFAVFVLTYLFF